jgi:hypothetical protein
MKIQKPKKEETTCRVKEGRKNNFTNNFRHKHDVYLVRGKKVAMMRKRD